VRLPERERLYLDSRVSALTLGAGYRADVAKSAPYERRMAKWRRDYVRASCFVCGARNFVLHHRTYERFGAGAEWDSDLVPLCSSHHDVVHAFVERNLEDDALWNAHKRVRDVYWQTREAGVRIQQRRLLRELICAKRRLSRDPGNERLANLVQRLETNWHAVAKVAM
jgi:hypothetical protein